MVLGPQGALSVDLVPNTGASPAGTFYSVVFQLDDGTTKTEYWAVPTSSPTTVAAVRTTPGATSSASQMATRQYVDAAVAAKASDASVVHVSGVETIAGAKQFSASPSVPAPVSATDGVNKAYVDTMVGNVGAGSYVSKAGDTMTGPLMLSGEMPVFHSQIGGQGKTPDGKVFQVPAHIALQQRGPVLPVAVGLEQNMAQALLQQGKVVPQPKTGIALIDTGASVTCIDEQAAKDLGLPVVDVGNMTSASHEKHPCNLYPAQIVIAQALSFQAPRAMGRS